MFHMSAGLRPKRSARRPKSKAPSGRMPKVRSTAVETRRSLDFKSNASSVQPKYAAITTLRWLLVHVIWRSQRTHRGEEYQLPFATAGARSMNKGKIDQIAATIIIPRQTPGRAAMRDA